MVCEKRFIRTYKLIKTWGLTRGGCNPSLQIKSTVKMSGQLDAQLFKTWLRGCPSGHTVRFTLTGYSMASYESALVEVN